ncbi:MAG: Na+/H+ antiporter NhaC family protein [Anaerovoracaceae bacterium]
MGNLISFLPITVLLIFAVSTRKMAESMIAAAAVALLLLHRSNLVRGTLDSFYETFSNDSFQFCVLIVFCFGIVIRLFQESGGLQGFAAWLRNYMKGPKSTLVFCWLLSAVLFVDEYLNALTVGFSMSGITDSNKIPREHLALQVHLMACSLCMTIPLTSWTAFTIGLIGDYGMGFSDYLKAVPLMFYPVMSVVLCLLLALGVFPKLGKLKTAYDRIGSGGPAFLEEEKETSLVDLGKPDESKIASPIYLLLPLLTMTGGTLYFDMNLAAGMLVTIVCQFVLYVLGKRMTVSDFFQYFFDGAGSMLMINIVLFFGFILSDANEKLGLFDTVIRLVSSSVPGAVIPVLTFFIVGFIVFASGTCWIVMLITMPIFIPLAAAAGASQILTLAALMSGVGAGYTLCFYADTVFMTTASTGVGNITIIQTILPYSVIMMAISGLGYLALGCM